MGLDWLGELVKWDGAWDRVFSVVWLLRPLPPQVISSSLNSRSFSSGHEIGHFDLRFATCAYEDGRRFQKGRRGASPSPSCFAGVQRYVVLRSKVHEVHS